MISGLGIDIIEVARFECHIKKNDNKLFYRLFTESELKYCMDKKEAAQCFAARFAAKEAFFKALGTGLSAPFSWKDIEVVHDERKRPFFVYNDKISDYLEKNDLLHVHLSISHAAQFALAVVVIEKKSFE